MCSSFANFVSKWHSDPVTLLSWSRRNCDKIHPRPADMSCDDIVQFVSDCNYGGTIEADQSVQPVAASYPPVYNLPKVLPKYIYYNSRTASDYGQFGNWYYPNYYPPTYLGYYDGRPASIAQLENDYSFARGGHYPFNRADNIVNIGLQQTSLPTCLHDLFYCVRAANSQNAGQYNSYREYAIQQDARAREVERRQRNKDSD
ncbi:unnamed protein product [Caenorhabditis auriculariae]|uniref:Uncharacterized protein n=1 Tax=Caenorhabditis auriculariae TaxID=2777116 RepID=A0A8S1GMQ6_9PELO|nr:unnamed protein product [Caenorhabditis auriculariae]